MSEATALPTELQPLPINVHGFGFTKRLSTQAKDNTIKSSYIIPVSQADAVVDVGTMMIELGDASVANPAMFSTERPHHSTRVTKP